MKEQKELCTKILEAAGFEVVEGARTMTLLVDGEKKLGFSHKTPLTSLEQAVKVIARYEFAAGERIGRIRAQNEIKKALGIIA